MPSYKYTLANVFGRDEVGFSNGVQQRYTPPSVTTEAAFSARTAAWSKFSTHGVKGPNPALNSSTGDFLNVDHAGNRAFLEANGLADDGEIFDPVERYGSWTVEFWVRLQNMGVLMERQTDNLSIIQIGTAETWDETYSVYYPWASVWLQTYFFDSTIRYAGRLRISHKEQDFAPGATGVWVPGPLYDGDVVHIALERSKSRGKFTAYVDGTRVYETNVARWRDQSWDANNTYGDRIERVTLWKTEDYYPVAPPDFYVIDELQVLSTYKYGTTTSSPETITIPTSTAFLSSIGTIGYVRGSVLAPTLGSYLGGETVVQPPACALQSTGRMFDGEIFLYPPIQTVMVHTGRTVSVAPVRGTLTSSGTVVMIFDRYSSIGIFGRPTLEEGTPYVSMQWVYNAGTTTDLQIDLHRSYLSDLPLSTTWSKFSTHGVGLPDYPVIMNGIGEAWPYTWRDYLETRGFATDGEDHDHDHALGSYTLSFWVYPAAKVVSQAILGIFSSFRAGYDADFDEYLSVAIKYIAGTGLVCRYVRYMNSTSFSQTTLVANASFTAPVYVVINHCKTTGYLSVYANGSRKISVFADNQGPPYRGSSVKGLCFVPNQPGNEFVLDEIRGSCTYRHGTTTVIPGTTIPLQTHSAFYAPPSGGAATVSVTGSSPQSYSYGGGLAAVSPAAPTLFFWASEFGSTSSCYPTAPTALVSSHCGGFVTSASPLQTATTNGTVTAPNLGYVDITVSFTPPTFRTGANAISNLPAPTQTNSSGTTSDAFIAETMLLIQAGDVDGAQPLAYAQTGVTIRQGAPVTESVLANDSRVPGTFRSYAPGTSGASVIRINVPINYGDFTFEMKVRNVGVSGPNIYGCLIARVLNIGDVSMKTLENPQRSGSVNGSIYRLADTSTFMQRLFADDFSTPITTAYPAAYVFDDAFLASDTYNPSGAETYRTFRIAFMRRNGKSAVYIDGNRKTPILNNTEAVYIIDLPGRSVDNTTQYGLLFSDVRYTEAARYVGPDGELPMYGFYTDTPYTSDFYTSGAPGLQAPKFVSSPLFGGGRIENTEVTGHHEVISGILYEKLGAKLGVFARCPASGVGVQLFGRVGEVTGGMTGVSTPGPFGSTAFQVDN